MDDIYKKLKEFGKVKINEPLSKHTTNKIGGIADFFIFVDSAEHLAELMIFLRGEGVEYILIGGGSNVLFSDERFEGVVISTVNARQIKIEGNKIIVDSGCSTAETAQFSIKNNLTGFEWGIGIPGTIGGALVGNAGAMGREMKDSVEKVEVMKDGEVLELSNEECGFGYRDSVFKHDNYIILRAHLVLEKSEDKDLAKKAMESIAYRNQTQPKEHSSGCIFKNIIMDENIREHLSRFYIGTKHTNYEKLNIPQEFLEKGIIPAGWLVEQVGMKGEQVGQAKVSEKHGNFIVNLGGATEKDIIALVEKIKEKVYDKFGIELEEEVRLINF